MYKALAKIYWLQSMLSKLGMCGTTYRVANIVFHAHTKHVEIDFHFVHDKVSYNALQVRFISNKD